MTAMRAVQLSCGYRAQRGQVEILRGADLSVEPGELVVIRGRSGSGKSTLLNVLGLLARPISGQVVIGGQDCSRLSAAEAARIRREKLGFVFQAFNLLPHLTALENVCLPLARITDADRGRRALAAVGIPDLADRLPSQLSGGEQQRVALARALVRSPAVVLADEPTGNLDVESEQLVLDSLRASAGSGAAVLVVSHNPAVAQLADRVFTIENGCLQAERIAAR